MQICSQSSAESMQLHRTALLCSRMASSNPTAQYRYYFFNCFFSRLFIENKQIQCLNINSAETEASEWMRMSIVATLLFAILWSWLHVSRKILFIFFEKFNEVRFCHCYQHQQRYETSKQLLSR